MSRLDDLIKELCPDGVPHKTLGEVASYSDTRVDASALDEKSFVGVDNLLANQAGKIDASYLPNTSRLTGYEVDDLLLGNIRPYLKKIWLATNTGGCSGDVLTIRISDEYRGRLSPQFLYYLLSDDAFFAHNMKHAKGAKMPRGSKPEILKYRIPVPPVDVQSEIVRVLDLLQALGGGLEAALGAELEARGRQYVHYRDSLLAFHRIEGVRWVQMGEVGEFTRGRRFTKDDVVEDGIPSIHYGEIYTNYGTATTSTVSCVRDDLAPQLRYARPGDVVIAAVGETVQDVGKAVAWLGTEEVAIHDDCFLYRSAIDPKFVAYYLQTFAFHSQKGKHVARAKVKRLSGASLSKVTIPVPPAEEQERIVAILDKFDPLVSDLSMSIRAELAARRKQYQYHRDRLLTFKEVTP